MKWIFIAIIVAATTVGEVMQAAGMRRHGEIRDFRPGAIRRAMEIVNQLLFSLDHAAGGDLSHKLAGLYAYIQSRLLEANSRQIEAPLAEVEKLLTTLLEGWQALPTMRASTVDPSQHPAAQTEEDTSADRNERISCTC